MASSESSVYSPEELFERITQKLAEGPAQLPDRIDYAYNSAIDNMIRGWGASDKTSVNFPSYDKLSDREEIILFRGVENSSNQKRELVKVAQIIRYKGCLMGRGEPRKLTVLGGDEKTRFKNLQIILENLEKYGVYLFSNKDQERLKMM
ncbi:hypothetical protein FJY90_02025 [Candidatus Gottesmanbacteria bacterium]|nr:hypothetical protein [Candidatus Gottesmanbacteria bacterium]